MEFENLKKTALFNSHLKFGGKVVDFAGWALSVQFEGIMEEHNAVRNSAGMFDVSHMGEVEIKGLDAEKFIDNLVTNDVVKMENNQIIYSFMCYENGGIVDDLLVYKYSNTHYYLVINAGNIDKDFEWMQKNARDFDLTLENLSSKVSEIALQGPLAEEILQKLTDFNLSEIKFFFCQRDVNISGVNCLVSRTGYTGEDGFEIYMPNEKADLLWEKIYDAGKELGLKPAGLGCRDTLRFEANLPLYGNELSQDISPLEAGYLFAVKLAKPNFIGKEALVKQKESGLSRKIVGFEMQERGIPRHGYEVTNLDGKLIGFVTTGYLSPTLNKNIGLAMVDINNTALESEFNVIIRNKPVKAKVTSRKFYTKNYKK